MNQLRIARRAFVRGSMLSASGVCMLGPTAWGCADRQASTGCTIFDLGPNCVLRESLQGYRAALNIVELRVPADDRELQRNCVLAIVPGLGVFDAEFGTRLKRLLVQGASVLLESGGGFLNAEDSLCQRRLLQDIFDVVLEEPVDLWLEKPTAPYVHYTWPIEAMVRDFSRVVPVVADGSEIVGRVGALPVAVRKSMGNGRLIVLGSAMGPALFAGDVEARAWLQALLSTI